MNKSKLIFTTDKCVGCNKCIKSCPGNGANFSVIEGNNSRIYVNPENCIHCGTCLRNCEHGAREFCDDLDEVLAALDNNEKVVLLVAPSFFLTYPDEAPFILGMLSSLGFYAMYDVSYGANITTWATLKYMKQTKRTGLISSACPVIVDYIEKYKPSLISRLLPIMSPAGCLMTYLDYKIYNDEADVKYAFMGPCIGKHDEYSSYPNGKKFDFTFTYKKLLEYVTENGIEVKQYGRAECMPLESLGRGCLYPIPGALGANIKNFVSDSFFIKQIEGPGRAYSYLDTFEKMMQAGDNLPQLVDILNCEGGCNEGVATNFTYEDSEILITNIFANLSSYVPDEVDKPFVEALSKENRRNMVDEFYTVKEDLDYRIFTRKFIDDGFVGQIAVSDENLEDVYISMHKFTDIDRNINCSSCGYKSCRQMATAIYYGNNRPENCVHYVKDLLLSSKSKLEEILSSLTGGEEKTGLAIVDSDRLVESLTVAINDVEKQREDLNNSIHARTNMFASLTHELRTPLNAIMSMTDMMDTSNLTPEQISSINSIKTAGNGLIDIIGEILDFSKLEAGKFNIIEDTYCVHQLLGDVTTVMNFRCMEKNLQLNRNIDPTLPDILIGDEKRIRQICINITGNAIKYTNVGSVTVDAGWNHDKTNPVLIWSISDTGVGIKEEDIPFLFDSYKQVNEAENHHIVGTGLGLSISKSLADSMKGTLSVESTYGVGSKFTLTLPQRIIEYISVADSLSKGSEETADTSGTEKNKEFFYVPTYKVLIVDDVAVNLQIARALLDQHHIYADTAASGEEAIRMCLNQKYDILFVDHLMPEMNGLETIAMIKASGGLNTDTPIVYLSAFEEGDLREIAGDVAQAFLEKPIKQDQLNHVLKSLIPEEFIQDNNTGSLPSPDDIRAAAKEGDLQKLLILYSEIERYCISNNEAATARFMKKFRIMLQQGEGSIPIANAEGVIGRCRLMESASGTG